VIIFSEGKVAVSVERKEKETVVKNAANVDVSAGKQKKSLVIAGFIFQIVDVLTV
jgi:hypothetical protein